MKLTVKKLLRAIGEADEQMVEKAAPKQITGSVDALKEFVPGQTEAPVQQRGQIIRRITEIGLLCAAVARNPFGLALSRSTKSRNDWFSRFSRS